jgi:hypothetical protein
MSRRRQLGVDAGRRGQGAPSLLRVTEPTDGGDEIGECRPTRRELGRRGEAGEHERAIGVDSHA